MIEALRQPPPNAVRTRHKGVKMQISTNLRPSITRNRRAGLSVALRRGAALIAFTALVGAAHGAHAGQIKTVFVIALENHNWTQPANQFTGGIQQLKGNSAAPYINSLVNGTSSISDQVAYTDTYHNVLATPSGANPHIHPSEPNYLWAEGGTNYGVLNDNTPYQSPGGTNQNTSLHLSTLMSESGVTWKSYQEDIDLAKDASGKLTSTVLPQSQWTSPINNISGTNAAYTNPYNGSHQYDYATKHNPQVFFSDTNGGNDPTSANPASKDYAPLQQLQTDLANHTVSQYNWITPDQFNDMHTALSGGYKGLTGDAAKIKQGDDFLAAIIPMIMASPAYQNDGAIVIWNDETEGDGVPGDNSDDFNHTSTEIVISKDAHPNVGGLPYDSLINYTHSSDLLTWQEVFNVGPCLGDACNATDLSDLFAAGVIPQGITSNIPEPASLSLLGFGLGALVRLRRRRG